MAQTDLEEDITAHRTARLRTPEQATSFIPTDNSAVSRSLGSKEMITNNIPTAVAMPMELREDIAKNSKFQVIFATAIDQGRFKVTSSYKSASVLLLSWPNEPDEMNVQKEVDELEEVFKTHFNYTVVKRYLRQEGRQQTSLQVIVLGIVSDFLREHDGPDNLLIVYYAGHGVPGPKNGELQLQACYAGNLGRNRQSSPRDFDYLAATSLDGLTKYPGEDSFTAALIWSLKELVSNNSGGRFTSYDLYLKIKDQAPNFPRKEQKPELFTRLDHDHQAGLLLLHPISKGGNRPAASSEHISPPESRIDSRRTCEILTIKFYLKSDMTEDHVDRLAKELHSGIRRIDLPVTRIVWGGLRNIAQGAIVKWRERSSEHRRLQGNPTSADIQPLLAQEQDSWQVHGQSRPGKPRKIRTFSDKEIWNAVKQRPTYLFKTTLAGLCAIGFASIMLLLGMMIERFYAVRPATVDVFLYSRFLRLVPKALAAPDPAEITREL